ncbi:MFS transporter [Actinomadura kijaniata]|uniref:MFS transporter n=1 Tax=Actinomadura kijaniata TaxID=46161 RepID=UPI00082B5370|nr:MFS transporter [Actinomadura kijaniata]
MSPSPGNRLRAAPTPRRRLPPAWLLALALATFAFSTDDYIVAGILPGLAADLGVTQAAAGQLVTVFSVTFAVASPVAAVVTATWPRRRLFTWALLAFTVANLAVAAVSGYAALMALRVVAALAAAVVVPAALATAAALAPPERQGRFLALVMTGLTGSFVVGVPLGTWIAAAAGWRHAFVLCGVLGACAVTALWRTLPEPPPVAASTLRERLAPLGSPAVLVGLVAAGTGVLGNMVVLTYLAPVLGGLSGTGGGGLGLVFVLSGLAGIAGGQLGGRLTDRWGPGRAMLGGGVLFIAAMLALLVSWALRPVPLAAVLPFLLGWSMAAWSVPPPTSARLLALAGPAGPQALALNSSAVYLGVAGGGGLGGALLSLHGPVALPAAAASAMSVGLVLFAAAGRLARSSPERAAGLGPS